MPENTAAKTAFQLLDRIVDVQATVLSYMDIFLWVGVMFLVCVPFILIFIKQSANQLDMSHMAGE
jgi:DHA2 family multidrug resistance protein